MVRLPAFPEVDKTPRRFVVSAPNGLETIVGPSAAAPGTGQVLAPGTKGRSEMVWSVRGWPGGRGKDDTRFVLLDDMGWVQLQGVGVDGDDVLKEVDVPVPVEDGDEEAERRTAAGD